MVWTFSNSIRPFRFRFRPFQIQTLPSLSNEVRSGLTQKGLWFKSVSLSHIYGIWSIWFKRIVACKGKAIASTKRWAIALGERLDQRCHSAVRDSTSLSTAHCLHIKHLYWHSFKMRPLILMLMFCLDCTQACLTTLITQL